MNYYKLRLSLLAIILVLINTKQVNAQACDSVAIAPIIYACKGGTVLLDAKLIGPYPLYSAIWTPGSGLSDATALAPTATLGVTSTSYSVIVKAYKPTNLVVNGDFNLGYTGTDFTSDYWFMPTPTGVSDHDSFAVDTDPSLYSPSFPVITDHSGGGNMLIVDGATDKTKNFWCETIFTQPSTNYVLTYWVNLMNVPSPVIEVTMDGVRINVSTISSPIGTWKKHSFTFLSPGPGGNVTICMRDTNEAGPGNDFAIDDISINELCGTFANTSVIVSDFKPVESFIAKPCKRDAIFFGADSVNPNITSHIWKFGDGGTDTGTSAQHTYSSDGTYTVNYVEIDKYGCTDSATAKVGITTVTNNIHATGDTTVCKGTTVQLHATGGKTYTWDHGTSLNDSTVADPKATPQVPTTYIVNAVDTQGCTGADTVQIGFFPPPTLHITPNTQPVTCANSSIQLFVSGAKKFIWQPGLLCDNNTSSHPIVTPTTTTTFYVYGSDGKGCDATDSITVICLRDSIYIPNAFTPNADGNNDYIFPTSYCDFIFKNFSVFDRWGKLVFSTDKEGDGWDGTYKGEPQPQGVYVYQVRGFKMVGEQVSKSETYIRGNITLLR